MSVAVGSDSLGSGEVARAIALPAHLPEKFPVLIERLYAVVQSVGNQNLSGARQRDVGGEIELAVSRAPASPAQQTLSSAPIDDDLLSHRVGDVEPVSRLVPGERNRTFEHAIRNRAHHLSAAINQEDLVDERVCHEGASVALR